MGQLLGTGTSSGAGCCGRPTCMPCMGKEGGSGGACWKVNPTFRISCGACRLDGQEALYIGESGYTAFTRCGWHRGALEAEDHRSALWQHQVRHHGGQRGDGVKAIENYKMEVTCTSSSAPRRLIREAILINDQLERRESQ